MSDIKRFPFSELIPIDLNSYFPTSRNFWLLVFPLGLPYADNRLSVVCTDRRPLTADGRS
jgi:hypothetical protein